MKAADIYILPTPAGLPREEPIVRRHPCKSGILDLPGNPENDPVYAGGNKYKNPSQLVQA
jgi:hypothetical protein